MRIRPSVLVPVACIALVAVACNSGNMEGEQGEESDVSAQEAAQDLELWQPMLVEDCGRIDAFLEETETSFSSSDNDSVAIEIHLSDDRLEATPGPVAVSRGQTVRWHSAELRWTLRFADDVSPFEKMKMGRGSSVIRGKPGDTVELQIPEDARCGLYHYVAAASDAEGNVYALDPPMPIK